MRDNHHFLVVRNVSAFAAFTLALVLSVKTLCESRPVLCRCRVTTVFLPPRQAP